MWRKQEIPSRSKKKVEYEVKNYENKKSMCVMRSLFWNKKKFYR